MDRTDHIPILKKVGSVLVAVGLLDIFIMIYCFMNHVSYSSSFNIFAVIAGIFLNRGSLVAAKVVRCFSVFMLSAFLTVLIAWPFMQPVNLTITQIHLNPWGSIARLIMVVLLLALLYWITRQLGQEAVQEALASTGRKMADLRIPAAVGIGIVIATLAFSTIFLGGETAARAKAIAEQKLGTNYRYHVSSINIRKSTQGTYVNGLVVAWNETEIKNFPVQWSE